LKKIFITRDLKETDFFKTALEKVGFFVFGKSLIAFSKVDFGVIPDCDWLFFYSKNGVKYFFENIDNQSFDHIKIAAIGSSTANYLEEYFQIKVDFIGTGEPLQTSKAFVEIAAHQTILFPRAKHSKQSIQKQLGNIIIAKDLIVYENQPIRDFQSIEADILVFTSPMNVKAYFSQMTFQPNQKIISIGNTTAETLKILGFNNFLVAKSPSEQDLVKAVLNDEL
jgi:uroporphyrinogen-III synthase